MPIARSDRALKPALGWRRRLREWWRDYQWPVLLSLELATLTLGYVGFREYAAATGRRLSPFDTLYLTLQLITLESGSIAGPLGWRLEAARLLVPAVTAYTAISAAALLFRQQVQLMRLLFLRQHVVICGLGQKGAMLADGFRRRGDQVVAVEPAEDHPLIDSFRQQGIIVLVGSAADPVMLQKARVHRAATLVAVTGDDGVNAQIAVHARHLNRRRGRGALTTVIHVVDPMLCELLRDQEIGRGGQHRFRLELFNVFERGARALLNQQPPFVTTTGPHPHLLIVGLGRLGESVLLQAARMWHDRGASSLGRLRVTVIDRDALARIERLCARYPQMLEVADLIPCQITVDSAVFEAADFLGGAGVPEVSVIYVLLADETLALKAGLTLLHKARPQRPPIVVRIAEMGGLAALLRDPSGRRVPLIPFDLLTQTCTPEQVLGGTHDLLARALHRAYVRRQTELGETTEDNPLLVPWESLPPPIQESNRQQVDHIGLQLEAAGCEIAPLTDWNAPGLCFTDEEVDRMARREHDRWRAERLEQGWRFAPARKDLADKTHPALVPWDQLPPEEQEKNRDSARQLPVFLAQSGFQIVRPLCASVSETAALPT